MILYFKLDHENRIYLLFCTSIKIKDTSGNEDLRQHSPILKMTKTKIVKSVLDKIKIKDQDYTSNLLK